MSATKRRQRRARNDSANPSQASGTDGGLGNGGAPAARMLTTVGELCDFEERLAGSDAERRASNHMAAKLLESGRDCDVQPIHVHPQVPLVYALHCLLGLVGSLVAVVSAPVGFALALVAATSMYLDLNGRFYLFRLLFFRRASQNVLSLGDHPEAPAQLIIVANLDSARTGAFFDHKWIRRNERLARVFPAPYGPMRILFWTIAALLPLLGLRMAGLDSGGISALQLIPSLILLLGIFSLLDVELSDVVPGANTNASGAAVALELGSQLHRNPPVNLDVSVLLTGGGESTSEGMRAYVRANRKRFDAPSTFVLGLSSVGRGELRYVISQGLAVSFEMDRRLVELCDALAGSETIEHHHQTKADDDADIATDAPRALPLRYGLADEAFPARIARLRAISLTSLGPGGLVAPDYHNADDTTERVEAEALERARSFATELIDAIDRDVGRKLDRESD